MLILFDFLPSAPAIAANPSSLCPFGHQRTARGQPWGEAPPCALAFIKQELTLASLAWSPILAPVTLDTGSQKGARFLWEIKPSDFELDCFGFHDIRVLVDLSPTVTFTTSLASQYMEKCKLYL
ncbi:unnamed protein product, partial [Eretmochelys imbricata]